MSCCISAGGFGPVLQSLEILFKEREGEYEQKESLQVDIYSLSLLHYNGADPHVRVRRFQVGSTLKKRMIFSAGELQGLSEQI
jgi:hypothetical protein